MATLVLGAVGSAIGGAFGGAILGFSGAAIGGFIGSTIGSVVDNWIVSSLAPAQRIEGARLDSARITSSTEGAVIPRLYGRMRLGGNIIWATDFREETRTTSQGGGKGGGGGKVTTTEYLYFVSFAVALCEGPITGIGRVWADGKAMDITGVTWRWYPGDEVQTPDPFISAKMGAANTPAYRGTAYVVLEELDLTQFGNRLPQISFEVFRPLADADTAEGLVRAVTLIPASGEFAYATVPVKKSSGSGGATVAENLNAVPETTDTSRIASEAFPMAVPPEEAERRCRRALMEAWVGRESAVFKLPPSRLALDPCDVILLDHDGRLTELRLVSIADSDVRGIDAVRQDRAVYDLPPGDPRPASLSTPTVFGAPDVVLLDLPQLRDDQPAHRPFVAAHAQPWPGEIAVFRSAATDGFALLTTFGTRARMGALAADFYAGPVSRFDLGNALVVDLFSGTLESVTDITLLGGANALAVETSPDQWEIVQAGSAELIAQGRYRLTRLLRGQRGTENAAAGMVPTGARVVVLDTAVAPLPISEADLGLPWNWRIGPASRAVSDETYVATSFTPEGVGLQPFSVAHVEQPWRTARSPGDLTIRWTRRSRSLAADTWGVGDVPLSEDSEAYALDILDGAVVKRSLTTGTTSALYTAAQQTADWGALLGPGNSLQLRIYQLSALIGPGAVTAVTLSF